MSIELTDEELHDEMVEWQSKDSHDYRFPNCKVNHWTDRCELCGAKPMTVNCNNANCTYIGGTINLERMAIEQDMDVSDWSRDEEN